MLEIRVREIRGNCPVCKIPRHAYMQCVDPGKPDTEGEIVIFEVRRI